MDGQKLRILAIEPDPACREQLRALLAQRTKADVVFASSSEDAAGAIHDNRPDLILTSAMLPPRAEAQMIDALKHLDPDGTVPVITVPPLLDLPETPKVRRGIFRLISRRRTPPPRPPYDVAALMIRIEEALREAGEAKEFPRIRPVHAEPSMALVLRSHVETGLATMPFRTAVEQARAARFLERKRMDRARRFGAAELPAPCTLTTPAGLIVRMLNVSNSGVLFESPLKFTPDDQTLLNLLEPNVAHVLSARIVRSEVASVTGLGVTYQTAAQFGANLDIFQQVAPPVDVVDVTRTARIVDAEPHPLADLLVRVTNDLYQHQRYNEARTAFESGLRQLVPACDVRLSDRLVQPADGGDSIYFAVPGASGVMVQATFGFGHKPSAEELRLLRAAAAIASVIVHSESPSLIRRSA
jgi:hypothetical protein